MALLTLWARKFLFLRGRGTGGQSYVLQDVQQDPWTLPIRYQKHPPQLQQPKMSDIDKCPLVENN